jgi:hypothetical protein
MDDNKKKRKKPAADKDHKTPWQERYASVVEMERFIDDRVALRYNVVTHRTEYHKWSAEIKSRLQMLAGQFPIDQVTDDG